jgi:hypothetical protein
MCSRTALLLLLEMRQQAPSEYGEVLIAQSVEQ